MEQLSEPKEGIKLKLSGNRTELFCIIGMPAKHSLSPLMHNSAFSYLGIDAFFFATDVQSSELANAIQALRTLGIKGMTLTSPHKKAVMKYIDVIDKDAERIGAVNTVVNLSGKLVGYNTDAPGFINAITKVTEIDAKNFVIIGAGGAARAFIFEILKTAKKPKVTILNRTIEHALKLKEEANVYFGVDITAMQLNDGNVEISTGTADIIVNATNVDLENKDATPVRKEFLRRGQVVFDANYVPARPKLIRDAEETGCITVTGDKLLLHQGVVAFKLFTGMDAPVEVMENAVSGALKETEAKGNS